ncbi:MAG: hypothetical protein J7L35_10820 [Anaerolineales bacterium]|nr:hypothetical protein [Anaerolineales bacterium]
MAASYHINPSKYPLQELKKDLLNRDLIPSPMTLKDDLETNFQILEGKGIQTPGDWIAALKNINTIGGIFSLPGISEKF